MKLWVFAFVAVSALSLLPPAPSHAGTLPDITGTWYAQGDRSKRCRIDQSGTSLSLRNEDGWTATGSFVNPSEITTRWGRFGAGTTVTGRISSDLETIRWSNGTFWTRAGRRAEPTASPTPNPYRELRLASLSLEDRPQGKIALLNGWAAVKRDGHGAVVCVAFKNEAAVAATRVVFAFTILGATATTSATSSSIAAAPSRRESPLTAGPRSARGKAASVIAATAITARCSTATSPRFHCYRRTM